MTPKEYTKAYNEGKKATEKMSYPSYLLERCNLIINLVHSVAVPNGRGGNYIYYSKKVAAFNRLTGRFISWVNMRVYSPSALTLILAAALTIITYSWFDKDISRNKVLVYINQNKGSNQFKNWDNQGD